MYIHSSTVELCTWLDTSVSIFLFVPMLIGSSARKSEVM